MTTTTSGTSRGARRTLLVSLLLGLAFAVGAIAVSVALSGQEETTVGAGQRIGAVTGPESRPLPAAELEALEPGEPPLAVEDLRGTPLVVNFWATWCAPCVAEMPALEEASARLDGKVTFVGVNYRDTDEEARAFAGELAISYPLVVDRDGSYLEAVDGVVMPTTLFVDAGGTIVYRYAGAVDEGQLLDLVREHLGVDA